MSKRILITGANRGVGLALVHLLAKSAEHVYAGCRRPASAEALQQLARSADNISVIGLDVTDAESLKQASDAVVGGLDLLVCNAGILNGYRGLGGSENALTPEAMTAFAGVLTTNIAGPFFTVQAFSPHLRRSGSAGIAIISSHMGSQQHDAANAYAYRSSKAGVNNIMVTLSHELAEERIAVAAYHPGWVRTDMGGASAHLSVEQSAEALAQRFAELDMGQNGQFINYDGSALEL
ncbi:MAG: SDR family NAD(P)-dependent oxidoreductase [Proteobacteria bacterium]|nr:SDR family NAD(P)-dependent oxidoreductase [Pseudomonadota bacterium]